ncbi:molybdopterin synthase catalytic subunit MoaE [Trinickia terrae]|uniref:Molybdopterin synthase catalytic subunit n=1 Tax=Trinickia terrae TaxID=2571161 RepID=A0A4U1I9P4_9BURK|nr:molybdopterin synthase catalytic subunit MoaE [Trinickia terrae]TKC90203.1 molybdopterin synthase catalytic subunit MoaE [Trinickia terrae]
MTVRVQTADFDLTAEVAGLRADNPKVGAIACFVGTVRDLNEGERVEAMELEHYPGMTEKALEAIAAESRRRWPGSDVLIVHRVGKLYPLDQIVLVATTAAHRGDAFASCEFVMDYLKTQAPFWKKEKTDAGERWVDARSTDDAALARWGIEPGNSGAGASPSNADRAEYDE